MTGKYSTTATTLLLKLWYKRTVRQHSSQNEIMKSLDPDTGRSKKALYPARRICFHSKIFPFLSIPAHLREITTKARFRSLIFAKKSQNEYLCYYYEYDVLYALRK